LECADINHLLSCLTSISSNEKSDYYREVINTNGETYEGSNVGNLGGVQSEARDWMGREHSILIHLPPLATLAFKLV